MAQFRKGHLDRLPMPNLDFSKLANKSQHDKMVKLVEQMLDLHQKLSKARTSQDQTSIQRQITATDRQIDQLVYELYDLNEEEIAIVESQ